MVAGSGLRRPGRRIAGPPIDEIELGIVGAGDPARSSADLPGVGVLRPSLVPLLAARRNGISAPKLLAGLWIPAVDEAPDPIFGARDACDQNTIRDQWRARHRVAFFPFGRLRLPNFLSGLCLISDDMGIERGAEYLAFIDRGALVGDAATHDAGGLRRPLESLLPDLLSGSDADCDRGLGIGHVHHAVVDDRLCLLAPIVVETETPDRHQSLDRLLVDLLERAVAVLVVSHPVGED